MNLEKKYPFIASWVVDGQIQIGQMEGDWEPFAAVLDAGGVIWSTDEEFDSFDALFDQMELAIGRFCQEHGLELIDREGNIIPWPK